jgi:isoleucyl-tRNA synthetase
MSNKNLSVHLQDFPDVSFIQDNDQLVADMDIIRDICGTILFIRDQRNLRVRLPLNEVTIYNYGNKQSSLQNIKNNKSYQDLIKDEVNVKNVQVIEIADQNKDVAQFKLQLNFKKIGAKLGPKMKEISAAANQGNWEKIDDKTIKIGDITLGEGDFEIKLIAKDQESSAALPTNDCVVKLDINVTKELEEEGIARDIIRMIQQNRKEADLDVSDRIKISFFSQNKQFTDVVKLHNSHIKEQTLANEITITNDESSITLYHHTFDNNIEEVQIKIGLEK